MAALRAQQNREWRERREEARKEEVAPLIHLSNNNHDDDGDDAVGNDDDFIESSSLNRSSPAGAATWREIAASRKRSAKNSGKDLLSIVLWATMYIGNKNGSI